MRALTLPLALVALLALASTGVGLLAQSAPVRTAPLPQSKLFYGAVVTERSKHLLAEPSLLSKPVLATQKSTDPAKLKFDTKLEARDSFRLRDLVPVGKEGAPTSGR